MFVITAKVQAQNVEIDFQEFEENVESIISDWNARMGEQISNLAIIFLKDNDSIDRQAGLDLLQYVLGNYEDKMMARVREEFRRYAK